jgi:predicted branched-subunit amino acid permease
MNNSLDAFRKGLRGGIPIALGYLFVSFTFGVKAVNSGIPPWTAVLISLTNVTSAGQFAGINMIAAGSTYVEIAVTTFVINIRYMLMSLALSQKLDGKMCRLHRFLFGFGITDEVFAIAVSEPGKICSSYMYGLILFPIAGWTTGTALGAFASNIMPSVLTNAMELGLYAMFIAIIIPPAKKNKVIAIVILIAVALSCVVNYVPIFHGISTGFKVIIAAILAATVGAILHPVKGEENEQNAD